VVENPLGPDTVIAAFAPDGKSITEISRVPVIGETVTTSAPDFVGSCVEVAVTVAEPAVAGIKTPPVLTVPTPVGLTDQVTEELKLPVPLTVGVQVDV
jgi:hypothetical protein